MITAKEKIYPAGTVSYFFDYYSNACERYYILSSVDRRFKNALWKFKDGTACPDRDRLIEILVEYLKDMPNINDGSWSVFCIPASSEEKNIRRYTDLINRLKAVLPNVCFLNDLVKFTGTKEQKHTAANRPNINACSHIKLTQRISRPNVVIIDDIVTKGEAMMDAKRFLSAKGARNFKFVALGKNYYAMENQLKKCA